MGLSLLGVTFSSTIISHCTYDFGCAGVRGVVAVAVHYSTGRMLVMMVAIVHVVMVMVMVMMVVMDLRVMVKVCAAVYLLIPHLALEAWRLPKSCQVLM